MRNKKAVSPVVSTILLIMIAIIIAIIILLWARGFMTEQISKMVGEESRPIEEACSSVNLEASVSESQLLVTNSGNIPVYKLGVRIAGKSAIQEVNILPGASTSITLPAGATGKVEIIPILLGQSTDNAVKEYTCPKTSWNIAA